MSPWAKCWLNTGWRSRSRGKVWAEEANVAKSVECRQVDCVVGPRGGGYVAPAAGYHAQIQLIAEIVCQNAALVSDAVFLDPKRRHILTYVSLTTNNPALAVNYDFI